MTQKCLCHPYRSGQPPPTRANGLFTKIGWFLAIYFIVSSLSVEASLQFTSTLYNGSVPENAFGNTAVISDDKMGMFLGKDVLNVKYRITAGDPEGFFKTSARAVGDFCFLELRVKSGNRKVLNRESRDSYTLQIKAQHKRHDRSKEDIPGAVTQVHIRITDLNDIAPIFLDSKYQIRISEDAPLYSSIAKVKAEDPDDGLNGQVYYSFQNPTPEFAIHPTSGVVSLTRPLSQPDQPRFELTVVARDRGLQLPGFYPSTASLIINVTVVNVFQPTIEVIKLSESISSGHLVVLAIINVRDNDIGPSGEVKDVEIIDGDPDRIFRIIPGSSLNEFNLAAFDTLKWDEYPTGFNLSLKVTDNGARPRFSYKPMRIAPPPLPPQEPIFTQEEYEVSISESAPPGSKIVAISTFLPGTQNGVSFTIVAGNEGEHFHLDRRSGVLLTARPLDAEIKDMYSLTVAAVSTGNFRAKQQNSAKVIIKVLDANDHTPIIVAPQGTVTVEEHQNQGSWVTQVRAQDDDSGENNRVSYSLVNLNDVPFIIDHFTGEIRTSRTLDFETEKRFWKLKVRAADWGVPFQRQSEKTIVVRVLDVNDNRPQFEQINCSGYVDRSAPLGTEIFTLSALDFDEGNIISYRILAGNDDRCFSLDSTSGVLTLTCDLQDLISSERLVNVTATDGQHFADTMTLRLQLVHQRSPSGPWADLECHGMGIAKKLEEQISLATKNNPKEEETNFRLMTPSPPPNEHSPEVFVPRVDVRVRENSDPGSLVHTVNARDIDEGYDGYLIYAISNGNQDCVFDIGMDTGNIVVAGLLDRERVAKYSLNITVYDLGQPQRSASQLVVISLVDENDNSPKFDKASYSFFLPENVANGTSVYQLLAQDPDEGSHGVISYHLETDTNDFHLDPVFGRLSVARPLDYERIEVYELRVVATDGGGRLSYAYVTVELADINDCAPVFPEGGSTGVRVPEDLPIGALVTLLTARDPDSPNLRYILENNHDGVFELDDNTAALRLAKPLDFETKAAYNLSVRATDDGIPPLSSHTFVIIQVVDVNENVHTPVFGHDVLEAKISEGAPPHSLVVSAPAIDGDLRSNPADAVISYSIVGAEGLGLFYIDQKGDLYTSSWLDRETTSQYWLTIRATDSGTVARHATLHIYVEVTDVNDNLPLSSWPVYFPAIQENSPPNTLVFTVVASDPDLDASISYSIVAGNPQSFFRIDKKSGEIRTTERRLDREHASEHFLHVQISDGEDPATSLSSTAYVIVSVSDDNDHAPEFLERIQKLSVPLYGSSLKDIFADDQTHPAGGDKDSIPIGQMLQREQLMPFQWENSRSFHMQEGSGSDPFDRETGDVAPFPASFSRLRKRYAKRHLEQGEMDQLLATSLYDEEIDFFLDPVGRVIAKDLDEGENGEVNYTIETDQWPDTFKIHPKSGVIYAKSNLDPKEDYKLTVLAFDNGRPKKNSSCLVVINPVKVNTESRIPPRLLGGNHIHTSVLEDDPVGHLVQFINADDEDGDVLWFDITHGNENNMFSIGRENGNIILARNIDAEKRTNYNLTVAVTDGVNIVKAQVSVSVIDVNDNRPSFSHPTYELEVSENISPGTTVFTLSASDKDSDKKLSFSLVNTGHVASENKFKISPFSGDIILHEPLDREVQDHHILTVGVKDRITPNKSNYARVAIKVRDYNDHAPHFLAASYHGIVTETSDIGTRVLQCVAVDKDKGANGHVTYTILSGNLGGVFSLEPETGVISLVRPVNIQEMPEYWLSVKASDDGSPPKYSHVNINIVIKMGNDASPRFSKAEYLFEISENAKIGTYLGSLSTESHLGVVFALMPSEIMLPFAINPASGVLGLDKPLDFEKVPSYNLTIIAYSMNGQEATTSVIVSVKDENDNAPEFLQTFYEGHISESAPVNSVVLKKNSQPLVVFAKDADSEQNANLVYTILEEEARQYFSIDSSTGAIRTLSPLDHEVLPITNFSVRVHDSGRPRMTSPTAALVSITITDINDVAPRFLQQEYNATVLVPTHAGVSVVDLNATDLDFDGKANLVYAIVDGNEDLKFKINAKTGLISVNDSTEMKDAYKLKATISDGQFASSTTINVHLKSLPKTGLRFARDKYFASVQENSTTIDYIVMLHVLGSEINEHVTFKILNPTEGFEIRETSGVIQTTGIPFDREEQENCVLIIEASSLRKAHVRRVAHAMVHVVIVDKNDNPPIFVNTPYYGIVPVDSLKGSIVFKVHATDFDAGENSKVRYELQRGNGELFSVGKLTGEIILKQPLEGIATDHELIITAYDGGSPPLMSQVDVRLKVVDRSQPIFDKQFYAATVIENAQLRTPIITMNARSLLNQKLIYTLTDENEHQKFAMQYEEGIITVDDELDFESQSSYQVNVRAIDTISGKSAEVAVSIQVIDTNDNPPKFAQSFYNVSVSEAAAVASPILQVLTSDADSGSNAGVSYRLEGLNGSLPESFYMESTSGMLILKKALDKETASFHHFSVVATDMGTPPLQSTAQIYITVVDMNDNAPEFNQPSFRCSVSEGAPRGQFVSMVSASDNDVTDENKLMYSVVSGNDLQAFAIDANTGIVTVWNHQRLRERAEHLLNISVTDGVFTAYTRLAITTTRINAHSPMFQSANYETHIKENSPPETYLTTILASDDDLGQYGEVTYHFVGDEALAHFRISENTGEVWAIKSFDRERRALYTYTVMAVDIGGRTAFSKLSVFIDDENDNRPLFSQTSFKALIRTNASVGVPVLKITAEDSDEDINGEVRYRFHDSTPQSIQSIFGIEMQTGQISLLTDMSSVDTSLFEFFIDAVDEGVNSLHSNVAVLIRVINSEVETPKFSSKVYTFTVDENLVPGSAIETVSARYDGILEYSVEWGHEGPPPLSVTAEGTLYLRSLLNYEQQLKFSVVVSAYPKENPELIVSTIVVIEVQDVNDEIPKFESQKYFISAAENVPVGSNILKVSAHDGDSGRNSKIRFLLEDMLPLEEEPLFALDPYSGWLSLNKKLDAEKKSKYELIAIVSDNGTPPQSSKSSIIIQVIDYNDNAPTFSKQKYHATVLEDAWPGTVVLKLQVEDLDIRKELEMDSIIENELDFYITEGNEKQRFHVKRGGQVYVARGLDREEASDFFLTVTVTDGIFVSTTQVHIEVLDVNDNAPICTHPNYQHLISEDASPGTLILRVSAWEPDIVSPPQYFLSGEGSEKFSMDQSSGQLAILKPLDRESQSKFILKATVRDGTNSKWQCICTIQIDVSDANDNPPLFSQESYSINVPENSPKNLLLKKIYASDPDMGLNRKVSYSLAGSNKFTIDRQTGILSVTESLDREKQAMYNLTVIAHDYGTPRLSSSANILVLVSDMNDNPPEFASHTYYTTIMESSSIGSDIVRVLATSRDSGKNAEISYSIIGGNEHKKFDIHTKTGVVSVVDHLDFERGSNYLLTIQAKDGGEPPLSNHATVNVTVTDINDNAPIFIQNSYSAIVNEAALNNERLLQVVATDQDSGENGRLTYAISGGDPHIQFRIDEYDGWISVARPLDRETTPSYTIEVIALDRGIPQRSGTVSVYIEVMDANDNPPRFVAANNTAYVQEDKPVNHLVYAFEVTDNDSDRDRNGAPFTFDIVAGNSAEGFRITPDGELRTATQFNHKVMDLFKLQIRVFDNGRPPLFSDTWINIKIIEESQFPPSMFPLHIMAFIQPDTYSGGALGKIQASDEDPYDNLKFSIASKPRSPDTKYFAVDEKSGTVSARSSLDAGSYVLNISITDDKFTIYGEVSIELVEIVDEMLDGATVVQLRGASPDEFLLSYRRSFHRGIKNIFKVKSKDVLIISIQDPKVRHKREKSSPLYPSYKEGLLDILFLVRKPNGPFMSRSSVRRKLISERKVLENTLGLSIDDIPDDPCKSFSCANGQCRESVTLEEVQVKVATDAMSFVSPFHRHESICVCPPGYSGKICETVVNQCAYQPCPKYQDCVPQQSEIGYMCICPNGLVGATCSKNKSDCIGKENTPQCYSPVSPLSLKGRSYLEYLLDLTIERHFSFSLWIRSLHPSGNLMFTSGRLDYSNLEIHEGHIQFRWDLGSGEGLVTVSSLRVDDGLWHHVTLERIGSAVFLQVDGKWRAEGSSPGSSEILNLESYHLYLGAEVRPWAGSGKDPRHGFVGCIDDPKLENSRLPLTRSPSSNAASLMRISNVTSHCYGKLLAPGLCGTHPCLNGGTCEERDSSYICKCDSRFKGSQCEIDSNPCASSPCLNNGHCVNEANSYRCECPAQVSGRRCQFMYCNPNPCLNKGSCEEGISGPICKCNGFTGAYCNVDMNECEKNPCELGGTCINTYGGFKCMCPANLTGVYCDIPAAITAFPIGVEEIIYIVIGITGVVIIALLIMLVIYCRDKRGSRRQERMAQNHVVLNCKIPDTHHNLYKRNSKMSNIEASQSCTNRSDPLPLNPNEPVYMALNNFDTIRSYGSAGDELENFPQYSRDFVQNITKSNVHYHQNRNPSSLSNSSLGMSRSGSAMMMPHHSSYSPSEADLLVHRTWKEALNLKEAYYETGKIQNDVKFNQGDCINLKKLGGGNELQLHHPRDDSSVRSGASVEDMQEYHWDCSDWARPSQNPLPNILEVPGGEVRDSSSYHSNESNESIKIMKTNANRNDIPPVQAPVDPVRDMETLAADELTSECGTEFELDSRPDLDISQILDPGAESDTSLFVPQPERYETHPNEYLPRYHLNSETETDDERGKFIFNKVQSPYRKRTNIPPLYGIHPVFQGNFLGVRNGDACLPPPSPPVNSSYSPPVCIRLRNNRRQSATMKRMSDLCPGSLSSAPDDDEAEGISLFGAASNASDTDNVCDIEDSEVNSEFENDK